MKLPFMPETWSIFLPALGAGWGLYIAGRHYESWGLTFLAGVVWVLAWLILNFFRDFERSPQRALRPKEVISPADGKVVVMAKAVEKFYLKNPSIHIAIFMNPLNNHVQRAPYDGKVIKKVYHPGKFLAAYNDKADLVNEQAHLVVELESKKRGSKKPGRMVLKQIAGLLCRRVKTTPQVGERIRRGERIGRILLGSRVDLFLPKGFKPAVRLGDQVKAGVTILGELS